MNLRILFTVLIAAAAALCTTAVTASATVLTTTNGSVYTSTVKAEAEGSITLDGPIAITCGKSSIEGKVESHGSAVTAEGNVSSLAFSECGSNHVTVEKAGSLIAHDTSGGDATLTSNGAQIKVQVTSLGITCTYSTSSTDIGTLTGSLTTLNNATFDISSAAIPRTGGSAFCGSTGTWTGSYKVTTPSVLVAGPEEEAAAGLTVTPDPVVIAGENKTETAKVHNTGTVEIKNIKVSVADGHTTEFKEFKACKGNLAANASCKETFECLAGAKGKEAYFFAGSISPVIVITTGIKC